MALGSASDENELGKLILFRSRAKVILYLWSSFIAYRNLDKFVGFLKY